ncbi:MAG: hypothetical protein CVV14_00240 [Gammaproteobacteria bacterium HGW-Gammaproteobacteria-4]|jgi:hypothetical protein|nr:MAG: hypothetical protein CVV14_00240 [Gammaproteobacteria bacterium HGW-Gammaproteobacteria-4]
MNGSNKNSRSLQSFRARVPVLPTRRAVIAALGGLLLASSVSAGPVYHRLVMQGQVLSVDGNSLVVCIGDGSGAQVGQELNLVRHVRDSVAPKAGGPGFHRESIGKVRIAKIFDAHYASAEVVQGEAKASDMVELESK